MTQPHKQTPTETIKNWISEFVTKPNPVFGNLPPCPFAQKAIIENKELIQKNYKIMQLYTPSISTATAAIIKEHIKNYPKEFSKTNIRKMMIEDGFGEMNWDDLFSSLNKIHRG